MNTEALFAEHLQIIDRQLADAMAGSGLSADAVLIHSGSAHNHYADDQGKPFRAWGHFLRWVPVDRPDQFILLRPGQKPLFIPLIPQDFWHDQHLDMPAWWSKHMSVKAIADLSELAQTLPESLKLAFLGENTALAQTLGIPKKLVNPGALLNWLDYDRAYKTAYEVARIATANAHALGGHQAAHDAFLDGKDEFDIHIAYLAACRVLDHELPYPNIIALNKNAAILHYQHKHRYHSQVRGRPENQVLLIDAGCRSHGYCSDITRTWCTPGIHPVFAGLLSGMQKLQSAVIQDIHIGMSFGELHEQTHLHLAQLLIDSNICRGLAEDLTRAGVTQTFLPHGLGHLLGLQVHDVGGRLAGHDGSILAPPAHYPALRNTRRIEKDMVFTIEPGLYFIPMLLGRLRQSAAARMIDWSLVDLLTPLGGIRIEDNVWIKSDGVHNLTRRPLLDS
ncbi:MAG: Xaa-Pro dipeptidase [Pseudohongiella sp.]|nr:Xaa-Pro dipeptidase [Pseudohongiella sp.]MDO9518853.1 Xaa-Pro dipeptidase [Pseudohongiella sp.]MDP2128829.1 Xaa-Pro dipeptidase [Pseudohongiella sp.]